MVEQSESQLEHLENLESGIKSLVLFFLAFSLIFEFLDLEGECRSLVDNNGAPVDGDTRVGYLNQHTWKLAPFRHARTWDCDANLGRHAEEHHAASFLEVSSSKMFQLTDHGNLERAAICLLKCQSGYSSSYGISYCDSLGGGGMMWSHLNAGITNHGKGIVYEPGCCISTWQASQLQLTSFTHDKVAHSIVYTWDKGFARSCQTLHNEQLPQGIIGMFIQACGSTDSLICASDCDLAITNTLLAVPPPPTTPTTPTTTDPAHHPEEAHHTEEAHHPEEEDHREHPPAQTVPATVFTAGMCRSRYVNIPFPNEVDLTKFEPSMFPQYSLNDDLVSGTLLYEAAFTPRVLRLVSANANGLTAGLWKIAP
jgi:hypothetical protein